MKQTLRHQKDKRLAAFAYLIVKKITKIKQKEQKKQVEFLKKFEKGRKTWREIKFSRGNEPKWVLYCEKKSAHIVIVCRGEKETRERERA